MTDGPRSREQRIADALARFGNDVDVWVATAGPGGASPYLTPLSFLWYDDRVLLATPAASPTGQNLETTGTVRLGFGLTRDVVLVEGTVTSLPAGDVDDELGAAFATKTGFDPRDDGDAYRYYWVRPVEVRAWREVDELRARLIMRDGRWL